MKRQRILYAPEIPTRWNAVPGTKAAWFTAGERLDELDPQRKSHPWYLVLWLTGVDYFSTLGYQPGIALLAAGALSPIATLVLIAVTLLGALPIYSQVARYSFAGQGSIAMLENLLPGWRAKIFVLVLLGFAATDFVITMTLSAADAARHAIENPYLHPLVGDAALLVTLGLLAMLTVVFLRGFMEAIGFATAVAVPYLALNLVVIAAGLREIAQHPELLSRWQGALTVRGDWSGILLLSVVIFPKLALGMSGFETGVAVMPLIEGKPEDADLKRPDGVIAATRRLLGSAALIMSFLLILSSFVTTLLVPEEAYRAGGPANGRALAYLAHQLLGEHFGSVYDLSTILILWFAGASAMAGLLNLIPRYLPRFGMAPPWVVYRRPLVLILFAVDVIVTLVFDANVDAQGGAYATGVLVLMLSAAIAVAIALWDEARADGNWHLRPLLLSLFFGLVTLVFTYTLIDNVIERPDGVIIGSCFIVAIIVFSIVSRTRRSFEMRVSEMSFTDEASLQLWRAIQHKKVHLAPMRTFTLAAHARKERELRKYYELKGPIAFVHVHLMDNRSEFVSRLQVRITVEEGNYAIEVWGAIAVANSIAYLTELIDPISIFFGLTRQNLLSQSLRYVFFGEGEIGLMVYTILLSYWKWSRNGHDRPLIFMVSE